VHAQRTGEPKSGEGRALLLGTSETEFGDEPAQEKQYNDGSAGWDSSRGGNWGAG